MRVTNLKWMLAVVAILALAITIGLVLHNLMAETGLGGGYGMSFGDLFSPLEKTPGAN